MPDVDLSHLPQPLRILSEQPPRKKTTWEWLRDVGITGLVLGVISGLIAALVSAYFQHNRWYVEQRLSRGAADFKAASDTFEAISANLSEIQSLQEILFFTYRAAAASTDPDDLAYLAARAHEIFPIYEKGRVTLRQRLDSYIFGVRRHLDWASGWSDGGSENALRSDPLSYGIMSVSGDFDCRENKTMPASGGSGGLGVSQFKLFNVDWNSATHHLIVIGYCFRKLHDHIARARFWAGTLPEAGQPLAPPPALPEDQVEIIREELDNQVYRLNRFTALGMTQVERIRQRNTPPDFWSYLWPK